MFMTYDITHIINMRCMTYMSIVQTLHLTYPYDMLDVI